MRIAVDAHAVGRKQTGNETYVRNLLREFASGNSPNEFLAYVSAPNAEHSVPARFRAKRVSDNPWIRLGFDLPAAVKRDRPDVLHVQYTAPLRCSAPIVATVHDVSYIERPEFFSAFRSAQLKISVRRTIRQAAAIIAPSHFSAERIATHYAGECDPSRIFVIPNGVDPEFRPMSQDVARRWVLDRYSLANPYILTVGDLQPRKNQIGLIRAFARLVKDQPELPHHLVLVGKENWHGRDVKEEARRSGVADRILFTGFVDDTDLRRLYCGSEIFVFPSFYEGFGLPILEAMACGRAVACSNNSAVREVANGAALLFDPADTDDMAKALRELLIDAGLRQFRQTISAQRAAQFSWEDAARKTLRVYENICSPREHPVRMGV